MLSYFPPPYEDEILYSTIARYHKHTKNISTSFTMAEVIKGTVTNPTLGLPNRIEFFLNNTRLDNCISGEELIENHTLFPFVTAFLDAERRNKIWQTMLTGAPMFPVNCGNLTHNLPQNLRFCPVCLKEDIKSGEAYWHRAHQLPFVKVCFSHGVYLRDFCPECGTAYLSKTLIALDEKCKNGHCLTQQSDRCDDNYQKHKSYAEDAYALMKSNSNFVQKLIKPLYIDRLKCLGLATYKDVIRKEKLYNHIINYYGKEFLQEVGSDIEQETGWVMKMFRSKNIAMHPIRHLLIIRSLFGAFEAFSGYQGNEYKPFGDGPWPCRNRAADHYGQYVVYTCILKRSRDLPSVVGEFHCDCGFIYSRREVNISDGKKRPVKILDFGHIWNAKLAKYLNEGCTYSEIAQLLGVREIIVARCVKKQSLDSIEEQTHHRLHESKAIKRKRMILSLITPGVIRSDIRSKAANDYDWLMQHERIWMDEHLPPPVIRGTVRSARTKVNWLERDEHFSSEVKQAVTNIVDKPGRPVKITKGLVAHSICKNLRGDNLDRLPKTKLAIESVKDTPESYKIRLVKWAVDNLRARGMVLNSTNIYIEAVISSSQTTQIVKDFIANVVNGQMERENAISNMMLVNNQAAACKEG